MLIRCDSLRLEQADGAPPTTLTAGRAPGESGVAIFRASFKGGAFFRAVPHHHILSFKLSSRAPVSCRIAGRRLAHDAPCGSLAILPSGEESAADSDAGLDAIFVTIDPAKLILAAAENLTFRPRLTERLIGQDAELLKLALTLEAECAAGYPEGTLFWNETAYAVIRRVLAGHSTAPAAETHRSLGSEAVARIRDYVLSHLETPIDVAVLADIAALSPFHFSRMFARTVGVSPHRYVVHLRLQRAVALIREGRLTLAEVAVRTGFSDQSHLTRWMRRVHGITPKALAA